jgi:hypothetical protein
MFNALMCGVPGVKGKKYGKDKNKLVLPTYRKGVSLL